MWLAWIGTVTLAAIAIAISFFVIMHRQYTFYEATHDSFFSFMLEIVPYLWLLIFIVSAVLALYHLRHTKRGYRYPLWGVAITSIFASLAGGTVLHYYGMSFMLDNELGELMPGYVSQSGMEKKFWQQPTEGRLVVSYLAEADDGGVLVQDMMGVRWFVATGELYGRDLELLRSGEPVRMIGTIPADSPTPRFRACGVFPWMYGHMASMNDMYEDREEAIARLRQHKARIEREVRAVTPEAGIALAEADVLPTQGTNKPVCSTLPAIRRLGE